MDWNQRYAGRDYLFGTEPNAFLASCAALLPPGGRALAIADGEGRNGAWLAEQGLSVTSFDGSARGVEKARRLAAMRGVSVDIHHADIGAWNWEAEAFDVVVAIFIQFAPPVLRAAIFAGMVRALRPGGLLLLQGYRPEQLAYGTGGPPQREHLYTEPMLREAFAGLAIERLNAHDQPIHEGAGHDGLSALIDLVARKPAR